MEDIAPFLFATMLFVVVPVVFMLLKHQQKMAELIHQRQPQQPLPNQNETLLLHEISRLRDVVAQQSIAIDNLALSQRKLESQLTQSEEISRRLVG